MNTVPIRIKRHPRFRAAMFWIAPFLAAFFLQFGCAAREAANGSDAVKTASIVRGNLSKEIRVVGPIRSDDSLEIYSEVQGKVSAIHAERGQLLNAGDKIVSIDASDADMELREARIHREIAQNELEIEHSKANNEAQIKKREYELQLADLKVEKAKRALAKYDVTVVQGGKLGWLSVKVGDYVAGKGPYSLGTKIADIVGADVYKIKVIVGERDVSMIRLKQPVEVSIDAVPGLNASGEVVDIQTVSDQTSGTPSFPITIKFSSISPEIKLGMTGSVSIRLAESTACLLVPIQALRVDSEQPFVVTLDAAGNRKQSNVTVGLDNGQLVEVRGQLSENQKVVLF